MEREENQKVDDVVERDMRAQKYLQRCGIYKFWAINEIRDQVRLLQTLINYWDAQTKDFNLDGKPFILGVDDI
jgi:hypothetical protein